MVTRSNPAFQLAFHLKLSVVEFETTLLGDATGPTGIHVPDEKLAELGKGKRPTLEVAVNGYVYTTTPGSMGGKTMLPFSSEHRKLSGIKAGDAITVKLTALDAPPPLDVPAELQAALDQSGLTEKFNTLAPSKKKEHVRQVNDAKSEETRNKRIQKVIDTVRG